MSLINTIHEIINFATDKGVTGYHPPDAIDREIHAVSTKLWQKFYDEYARTRKISSYMSPFMIDPDVVTMTDGSGTMNTEIEHPVLVLVDATEKEVEILERFQWGQAISDPVAPPTADYPICVFSQKADGKFSIEARPTTIASVRVYGLRTPKKPVWTYTIDNVGRRVFDKDATNPDGSTYQEIEWSELLHDDIRDRVLKVMGINLRETQVTQFYAQQVAAEGE